MNEPHETLMTFFHHHEFLFGLLTGISILPILMVITTFLTIFALKKMEYDS